MYILFRTRPRLVLARQKLNLGHLLTGQLNHWKITIKMAAIVNYIRSLADSSFSGILEHFSSMGVSVQEYGSHYMLVAPQKLPELVSNECREALNQTVGTIFKKESNDLVCFGFPKTTEILPGESAPFQGRIMAHQYTPGTLVRAYYSNDKWNLSTNGSYDAYSSYWISKRSIGELFDECLSRIYKYSTTFSESPLTMCLVPERTYLFMLQHPEMHLDLVQKPFIYHMGTFNNWLMTYNYDIRADRIPQPRKFLCNSFGEMIAHTDNLTGFIFWPASEDIYQVPRFKLLHPHFKARQELLGHTKNLYLRYLEAKSEGTVMDLLDCFPKMRGYADFMEFTLGRVAYDIVHLYIQKFVKRNPDVQINYFLRPIIAAIRETRMYVNLETVSAFLSAQHPKKINFILNGLGYIQTGDVKLPTPDEQLSEAELDVFEELVLSTKSTKEILDMLELENLEECIRHRFLPSIIAELIEEDEAGDDFDLIAEEMICAIMARSNEDLAEAFDNEDKMLKIVDECSFAVLCN